MGDRNFNSPFAHGTPVAGNAPTGQPQTFVPSNAPPTMAAIQNMQNQAQSRPSQPAPAPAPAAVAGYSPMRPNAPPASVLSPSAASGAGNQMTYTPAAYSQPLSGANVAPPPSAADVSRMNAPAPAPTTQPPRQMVPPAGGQMPAPPPAAGQIPPQQGYPAQRTPQQQQQGPYQQAGGYPQQQQQQGGYPRQQQGGYPQQQQGGYPQQQQGGYPQQQQQGGYPQPGQRPPYAGQPQGQQPHGQQPHGQQPQGYGAPRQAQRIDPGSIPSPVSNVAYVYQQGQPLKFHTRVNPIPPPANVPHVVIDEGSCSSRFMRPTVYTLPTTAEVARNSRIPMGIVVQPLAETAPGEEPVPVVDFGAIGPVRCVRCRGYINPFVTFTEGGRAYRCSLCQHINEVPQDYFCPIQPDGMRLDLAHRPELTHGSVDMVASHEYIFRTPVALGTVFVIDVSAKSVQSGLLATLVVSIRSILQCMPQDSRLKFGFVTYDESLHFYNLNSELQQPRMLVVPDIESPFLPCGINDLLVDYHSSKTVIDELLDKLPQMFQNTTVANSALGSAINAAGLLLKDTGGKLVAFQHSLPSVGSGKLEDRVSQQRILPDKDKHYFQPQDQFYGVLGDTLSAAQIGVDLFVFADGYSDIATISQICKKTSGEIYYFPGFKGNHDRQKLHHELHRNISRLQGYEAVMRVRTCSGISTNTLHGDFQLKRGSDMESAIISCDKTFLVTLTHDGTLQDSSQGGTEGVIQCAMLYTTSEGERRIRVHTISLQCSSAMNQVFRSADLGAVVYYSAKMAAEKSESYDAPPIRKAMVESCIAPLVMYRKYCSTSTSGTGQLILPESLKLLPVLTLGLMKHPAWRLDCGLDERAYWRSKLSDTSVASLLTALYPKMIPIHALPPAIALNGSLEILPPTIRLMASQLQQVGIYLISNGIRMYLWIGRNAQPEALEQLFGVKSVQELQQVAFVPAEQSPLAARIRVLIKTLQGESTVFQQLHVVKQGDPSERRAMQVLIEDGMDENMAASEREFYEHVHKLSYVAFLCHVHRKIQQQM